MAGDHSLRARCSFFPAPPMTFLVFPALTSELTSLNTLSGFRSHPETAPKQSCALVPGPPINEPSSSPVPLPLPTVPKPQTKSGLTEAGAVAAAGIACDVSPPQGCPLACPAMQPPEPPSQDPVPGPLSAPAPTRSPGHPNPNLALRGISLSPAGCQKQRLRPGSWKEVAQRRGPSRRAAGVCAQIAAPSPVSLWSPLASACPNPLALEVSLSPAPHSKHEEAPLCPAQTWPLPWPGHSKWPAQNVRRGPSLVQDLSSPAFTRAL